MRLKVFCIILVLFVILFTQCKKENIEPDPPEEFKIIDNNFLFALIARGFDENNNAAIDSSEALTIQYLFIDTCRISDLKGIQNFVSLKILSCRGNNLTKLDVSYNTKLTELHCSDNQLKRLKLPDNAGHRKHTIVS